MLVCNSSMNDFIQETEGKKVACFGNGYMINSLFNMYPHAIWEKRIAYIVDNDSRLWGKSANYYGHDIPIKSPETLRTEADGDTYVLITSMRYFEIIDQLDGMEELINTKCYLFSLAHAFTTFADGVPQPRLGVEQIPRVIHYCWFGDNEPGEQSKECIESWKRFCPDFEIKCWNEKNYDVGKHKYMEEAYKNKAYAFVSDYARLDILYNYGGLYMDTDVEVIKDLSPLLSHEAFCGFCLHAPRIASGLNMGSVKEQPVIKDMLDVYKYERYVTDGGYNKTMCQVYNTKALVYHGLKTNGRYQVLDGMTVYPKDYFDPKSSHFGIMTSLKHAYSIHHSTNTWVSAGNYKSVKDESKGKIADLLERIDRGGRA